MNKLTRVSEYLNVSEKDLEELGVYNGYANIDSELYINPKLLIDCEIDEFKNSYNKITNHFEKIIELLRKSKKASKDDLMWNLALKLFCFPEPNGVALGTSGLSINGNGLSGETAESALLKLKEMIDNDIDDPQIFGMLALIQKNIGVDRISDMISNIIYDDLLLYTENVIQKLNVTSCVDVEYNKKQYKIKIRENGSNLILIPKKILSNIPPFVDYHSIQDIIDENVKIKQQIYEMFYEINKKLKKKKVSQVNIKDLDKEQVYEIINKFNLHRTILDASSNINVEPYDFETDVEGIHKPIEKITNLIAKKEQQVLDNILKMRNENFSELVEDLINNYKFIIENKGLNQDLYHKVPTKTGKYYYRPKHEGVSHRLFIATLEITKQIFNYDYTYEPKSSNGEVDFRFYRNGEVIVVEFKLSTNKLKDGYDKQLVEYMKREKSDKGYYVIIKVKDDNAVDNFLKNTKITNNRPIVVVDGLLKSSPSHLHSEESEEM